MVTRLYFHHATNGTPNLPTTEQSSLTAAQNSDLLATNRSMNTTIGTGMTGLSLTTATGTQNLYFTRFVSPAIFDTSISANTWTYNFAAWQNQIAANFPVNGTNQPVRVNVYVWRPGTSTKIGTILDGNTASTVDEGPSGGTRAHHVTFSGSSVAGVQGFDVIIIEIWFIITADASGRTCTFYYDGTTVNTTDNDTVTNHASFLETPQDLNIAGGELFERSAGESITIDDDVARIKTVARSLGNSLTIEDAVSRVQRVTMNIASNTVSIVDDVVKFTLIGKAVPNSLTIITDAVTSRTVPKLLNVSVTITDQILRHIFVPRSFSEEFTIVANGIGAKFKQVIILESLELNDVITDIMKRANRTINQTVQLVDNVTRLGNLTRTLSETLTILDSAVGKIFLARSLLESVSASDITSRFLSASRSLANELTIVDSINGRRVFFRNVVESLEIDTVISKFYSGIRSAVNSITITDFVEGPGGTFRTASETVEVSDSVQKKRIVPRIITEPISIMTQLITKLCRGYPDE